MPDIFDPQYVSDLQQQITSKGDQFRFGIAVSDWRKALSQLKDESSPSNRKNLAEAEKAYVEIVGQMSAKYSADQENSDVTTNWSAYTETPNKADVYRFLKSAGWQISERTFYRQVGDGKLKKNRHGLYSLAAVRKFAETWSVRPSGKTVHEESEDLTAMKLREEIARIRTTREREAFKLEIERGKFLPRDRVEMELAGRAVVLEAGFDHLVYTRAAEWIAITGGDPSRTDMLIAALMVAKNEWLNHYASAEEFMVNIEVGA